TAYGSIRPSQRLHEIMQPDALPLESDGIHVHLVLGGITADAGDLGHSGNRSELVANIPILNRPKPAQVIARALDGIPEDLAGGGGVRPQGGSHSGRQAGGASEPLGHLLPRGTAVYVIFENDTD